MRTVILLALFFVNGSQVSAATVRKRNDQHALKETPSSEVETITSHTERKLSDGMFSTLGCNIVAGLPSVPCTSWTSKFGTALVHTTEVIVPCGVCIEMNLVSSSKLTLLRGLDIQGKLVFPDGYKLVLEAPYVRVQGELHMFSTKIPNGKEDILFNITGTNTQVTMFTPADTNARMCNGPCNLGKKPIVVAGGKLVIEALQPATPTWVNLYDVSTASAAKTIRADEYDSFQAPPTLQGCDAEGKYIDENFSTPVGSNFLVTPGTKTTYVNSTLWIHNRSSYLHRPQVDLKDVRNCLKSDRTYLLTVRMKLMKSGAAGDLTECAASNTGCFVIRSRWMQKDRVEQGKPLFEERKSHENKYGDWITVAKEVTFNAAELDATNFYQSIRFEVPGGIDIVLDSFVIRLPPPETYPPPSDVCGNLVPGTNAVKYHPFPFRARMNPNVAVEVKYDEIDPYFAVKGRTSDTDGLSWNVARGCVKPFETYRFLADFRIHDSTSHTPIVWLRGYGVPNTYTKVGTCPPGSIIAGFVTCNLEFTIPVIAGKPTRYEMYFELDNGPTVKYDVKKISFMNAGSSTGLVVTDSVKGKWGPGSQVLITSHTLNYDDEQVRTIVNVWNHTETGFVILELESPFIRPTTALDNPDYAVEIALLSRNIVFEGAKDDPENLMGAHLIIFQTPSIVQKLEGVEFRNFGQQGNLGRYPIHFHMCGDVSGSIVSKNLIRRSNQRCIVVHRTHNMTIDGNVAYDTSGHCFMTEDGNEKGNVFSRNLGALTRKVAKLIPDNGTNGKETDNEPATFWMTNPSNTWIGNVAAGSESNGYWMELRDRVRGPNPADFDDMRPRNDPLTLFRNNVAHSNRDKGLRTYPFGYVPSEQAVFYASRFYRNRGDGLFFHNSKNLAVVGGVFADNKEQLDFDQAEEIDFRDAFVIGVTPEYRTLIQSQSVSSICAMYSSVTGIQLHSFSRSTKDNGAIITNITISGFINTGCDKAAAFHFDDKIRRGSFDYFTTLNQINVEGGVTKLDACDAENAGVSDLYLIDIDSSLKPSNSTFAGTSTIVGDNAWMNAFLTKNKCTAFPSLCYKYCEDTCLRTVTYAIDPANTENHKLKVCSDLGTCVEVEGTYYYEEEDTELETLMQNTLSDRFRYFALALPKGSYTAVFLDQNRGEVWPNFVDETYEDAMCDNALLAGSVSLKVPPVAGSTCNNLIRNGDAEASLTDPTFWLHRRGGVALKPGKGRGGGGNAFGDLERIDDEMDAISQYLDTRCLTPQSVGLLYEIKAWVKLINPVGGSVYACNINTEKCPEVGIYAYSPSKTWRKEPVASMVSSATIGADGYQLIHGVLEVTVEMVNATSVLFYVERNKKTLAMLVDDVSMEIIPKTESNRCDDLFYNSQLSFGDSRFWSNYDSKGLTVVSPGVGGASDFALKTLGGSAQQYIKTGCLKIKGRYIATAKFKLLSGTQEFACDNETAKSDTKCPELKLRPYARGQQPTRTAGYTIGFPRKNDWNTMYGIFTADELYASADKLLLTFGNVAVGKDLIIDDVSIQPLPTNCDELILFGDMELGHVRFWGEYGAGGFQNVPGYNNSRTAIKYVNRTQSWHGPEYEAQYFLDYGCLAPRTTWEIRAQIKLSHRGNKTGASCQLGQIKTFVACPSVWIILYDKINPSAKILDQRVLAYDVKSWNSSNFNAFRGRFTVPAGVTELTTVKVIVRDFDATLDVTVDDFSIRKVAASP